MDVLITPTMKVDTALNRYPHVLDVFVDYGFKPLKNPLLRKTFAPLITIQAAAKMHHWPPERLAAFLAELNARARCAATPAEPEPDEAPPLFDLTDVEGLRAVNIIVTDTVIHLDNRGLEQPEPMVRILSVASQLAPGQRLEALNVRRPMLLYPKLDELGYAHDTEPTDDGHYRITVRRP
jgi:hypothetical protein